MKLGIRAYFSRSSSKKNGKEFISCCLRFISKEVNISLTSMSPNRVELQLDMIIYLLGDRIRRLLEDHISIFNGEIELFRLSSETIKVLSSPEEYPEYKSKILAINKLLENKGIKLIIRDAEYLNIKE